MITPDRIWIMPTYQSNGVDDFYLLDPEFRGNRGTEYVRADISAARTDLIRSALRFAYLSAGEGISIDGLEPEDFLMEYSVATGDKDWESIPDRLCPTPTPDPVARLRAENERLRAALRNMTDFALGKMDDPSRADEMLLFIEARAALAQKEGE